MLLPEIDVSTIPSAELPAVIGRLSELLAHCQVRLLTPIATAPSDSRSLTPDEGATIAGVSRRWLLHHTKGLAFRHDISKKVIRLDEAGLRRWLASRRTR